MTAKTAKPVPASKPIKEPAVFKDSSGWSFKTSNGALVSGFPTRAAARQALLDSRHPVVPAPVPAPTPAPAPVVAPPVVSKAAESACLPPSVPVVSSSDNVPNQPKKESPMFTMKLAKTNKAGETYYGRDGVTARIRFPKSFWAKDATPPTSFEMNVPDESILAVADASKPVKVATAVVVTSEEQRAKILADAEKALARAKKATEKAAKLQAKVDAIKAATPAPAEAPAATEAPAEPVTA